MPEIESSKEEIIGRTMEAAARTVSDCLRDGVFRGMSMEEAMNTLIMAFLNVADGVDSGVCFDKSQLSMLRAESVPKSAKVAHVKSQGQTRPHICHWPGCGKQCPPAKWGCYKCWMKLPKRIRDRIWKAYCVGQEMGTPTREYVLAAREAQEWIKEHYPSASSRR